MSGFGIRGSRFVVLAAVLSACGGGSTTSPSTSGGSTTAVSTTTITISNNAVSPANITVPRGSQVTFVNNDSRNHEMTSDPHPEHTDCPELNQVGFLAPGQSRQSGNLVTARTCGYHDHQNFETKSLQGTITIQ
ncbi:MAG TPA: cupredoxin domain-containing protein [Vicinamibacterales bacterium]|nr:cupredoxin domain-containing protein [Vicinamibacterales bacterium]